MAIKKTTNTKAKTNPGIIVSGGDIQQSDFDNTVDWITLIQDYTNMRNGDCIASSTIEVLKLPILQTGHRITTLGESDLAKEARDYITYSFDNLIKGFQYFKYHNLLALDFGLGMFEVVLNRGDKYRDKTTNRITKLVPIQGDTINKFLYDEQADFSGIEHERRVPEGENEIITLKKDELYHCTYNEEFNNVQGRAMYRPARKSFNYKQKIMDAACRAAQRGAGMVRGRLGGSAGATEKDALNEVCRTIANSQNSYYTDQEGKAEIDLIELKNQGDNMPMLEYLDRQMFFNSMSQFMTAGIGQNGSRAATVELKSSYELAANYVLEWLTNSVQSLIDRMIAWSPYYKLPLGEYPKITFNAITQADLTKVATNIKVLSDAGGIEYTKTDEKFFRETFGYPEVDPLSEIIKKPEPQGLFENAEIDRMYKNIERKIKLSKKQPRELNDTEKNIFEFESANEHFMTMKERAGDELSAIFTKVLKDAASQLKKNPKADLQLRYERELAQKLTKLFNEGHDRGKSDVNKELNKLRKQKTKKELTTKIIELASIQSSIDRWIKRFFFNVKTTLEDTFDTKSPEFIQSKGGVDDYVLGFETGFKTDKRQILKQVESGYIMGRGESLEAAKDEIETYMYSAMLDLNLCEECAPFDGLIMTAAELNENDISPSSDSINFNCLGLLGGNKCRCVVIAFELK